MTKSMTNDEMNEAARDAALGVTSFERTRKAEEYRARRAAMTPRERHIEDAKHCTERAFAWNHFGGRQDEDAPRWLREAAMHIEAVCLLDKVDELEARPAVFGQLAIAVAALREMARETGDEPGAEFTSGKALRDMGL